MSEDGTEHIQKSEEGGAINEDDAIDTKPTEPAKNVDATDNNPNEAIAQVPPLTDAIAQVPPLTDANIRTETNETIQQAPIVNEKVNSPAVGVEKKKDDDKLAIYKALAIKLKKELVKCREELSKLRESSQTELDSLKNQIKELETTLNTERLANATRSATLEASVKSLRSQLEISEKDLQALQADFENYKIRASEIMQQHSSVQPISAKTFEEERYKKMKELNDEQKKHIVKLESLLACSQTKALEFESDIMQIRARLDETETELLASKALQNKYDSLLLENDNLKSALKQFNSRFSSSSFKGDMTYAGCDENHPDVRAKKVHSDSDGESLVKLDDSTLEVTTANKLQTKSKGSNEVLNSENKSDDNPTGVSPSASLKDDSQTNSSSSNDSSTSAYVHIRPTTFEIISRSSVLEDAQNQIDNLTKAYLDSESTNSLLSEQIRALKEEIRRIQRGTERLDLAENLEYLKNVMFKFLSLDSNQTEQKQRLVPVLSTILKLSPEETAKLNSLAAAEKATMASSFFKL